MNIYICYPICQGCSEGEVNMRDSGPKKAHSRGKVGPQEHKSMNKESQEYTGREEMPTPNREVATFRIPNGNVYSRPNREVATFRIPNGNIYSMCRF